MSTPSPDAEPSETHPDSSDDLAVEARPQATATIHRSEANIRRAPKIPVFIVLGALIGGLVTIGLTVSFPVDQTVGLPATVGYFLLYGIPAGMALGALVAIVLDRVSARRTSTVTVEQTIVDPLPYEDDDEPAAADAPPPDDEPHAADERPDV
jgi:hypothetical protein